MISATQPAWPVTRSSLRPCNCGLIHVFYLSVSFSYLRSAAGVSFDIKKACRKPYTVKEVGKILYTYIFVKPSSKKIIFAVPVLYCRFRLSGYPSSPLSLSIHLSLPSLHPQPPLLYTPNPLFLTLFLSLVRSSLSLLSVQLTGRWPQNKDPDPFLIGLKDQDP